MLVRNGLVRRQEQRHRASTGGGSGKRACTCGNWTGIPRRDELIMRAVAQRITWRAEYDEALLAAGPPGGHEASATATAA